MSLWWRHNDHDSVSNHQPHECLLNRLFRRRSKKTSKLRVTGLCVGNSLGPVNSPHKGPVTRKMFPFDDVIMWQIYGSLCVANQWIRWNIQHWQLVMLGWHFSSEPQHTVEQAVNWLMELGAQSPCCCDWVSMISKLQCRTIIGHCQFGTNTVQCHYNVIDFLQNPHNSSALRARHGVSAVILIFHSLNATVISVSYVISW